MEYEYENLTDEQILNRLLQADTAPQKTLLLKRLGVPFTIQALTTKQVYAIRDRCTQTVRGKRGEPDHEELDSKAFTVRLALAGLVKPKFDDPKLTEKYQASGAEEVLQRILLAGELDQIVAEILALSGFDDGLTELKN